MIKGSWIYTDREEIVSDDLSKFEGYEWYIVERRIPFAHRDATNIMHLRPHLNDSSKVDTYFCGYVHEEACDQCSGKVPEEILAIALIMRA